MSEVKIYALMIIRAVMLNVNYCNFVPYCFAQANVSVFVPH